MVSGYKTNGNIKTLLIFKCSKVLENIITWVVTRFFFFPLRDSTSIAYYAQIAQSQMWICKLTGKLIHHPICTGLRKKTFRVFMMLGLLRNKSLALLTCYKFSFLFNFLFTTFKTESDLCYSSVCLV